MIAEGAGSVHRPRGGDSRARDRLIERLRRTGLEVPTSEANFVWLPLGDRSDAFARQLAETGVSVRCFRHEGVRITVGTPEANDLVVDAAEAFVGEMT